MGATVFHIVGELTSGDLAWLCNRNRAVDPDECWQGWAMPTPLCRRCERIVSS